MKTDQNTFTLKIELPPEVIHKLELVITETITRTLHQHVASIKSEPMMVTRKEAAKILRVTLPTLRVYELQGRLVPKRSGKRVLYTRMEIDRYIDSLRA
jgi:hypothetical protein